MKLLLTGFEPFDGETTNPSWQCLQGLPETMGGHRIYKLQLPVLFDDAANILADTLESLQPDAVICLGQAGGRAKISLEKVAINFRHARIPDASGFQPQNTAIAKEGPDAYFSTLPLFALQAAMNKNGIPACISYTAGTYVCNEIFYTLMSYAVRQKRPVQAGFIHVPYLCSQVLNKPANTPSMSLDTIKQAVYTALDVLLENQP